MRTLTASALVGAALFVALPPNAQAVAQTAPAGAVRADRDLAAETFVSTEANRALQILGDHGLSIEAKKAAFHKFVDEVADAHGPERRGGPGRWQRGDLGGPHFAARGGPVAR